jgi:hypothetical protein
MKGVCANRLPVQGNRPCSRWPLCRRDQVELRAAVELRASNGDLHRFRHPGPCCERRAPPLEML